MKVREKHTQQFYDQYWPKNVPRAATTRRYVFAVLPEGGFQRALDAGCGTGVCSLALAERASDVIGLDISSRSLATLGQLAAQTGRRNIRVVQGSLLSTPLANESVDLVWSWGVIHHTSDPRRALAELVRVLRPGGTIILAVYRKSFLTPLHEAIRWLCLRFPGPLRRPFVWSVASAVWVLERVLRLKHSRPDNVSIAAQVEDWFFVPEKHFFSVDEMRRLFGHHGLTFELLEEATGRFKSSSNFTVLGKKAT